MPRTLLIVDDDFGWVEQLTTELEQAGYKVYSCYDRKTALKMVKNPTVIASNKEERIDAVITDLTMWRELEAGFTFIREMKDHRIYIPTVVMTGEVEGGTEEVKHRVHAAGGDYYISKNDSTAQQQLITWLETKIHSEDRNLATQKF